MRPSRPRARVLHLLLVATAALVLAGCRTGPVTAVVDGDTLDVADLRVRVAGIDTPERGRCGYQAAKDRLAALTAGRQVTVVPAGPRRTDRYGREIAYVHADGRDLGAVLIAEGLAVARYDGLDGYGRHLRQDEYRRLDAASANVCK